ncbi:MAG: relaxase [Actinobacteria bacterium]|nr:relaxase [Actinomycetota bacterium]
MIGKVMRGRKVGGLLRYLYGPGKANEHVEPHLVASWDDNPAGLEPATDADGRLDVRTLSRLLEQPLSAAVRPPDRPVWHCAVRTAPTDRRLSDEEWRDVARDIVARTGLAPDGDDGGCRWVAVRHAVDHIHLVVTLARQDGAPARTSNDFYRVGEACRAAEARLGLARTAPRDRTAPRRPTRAESEKAVRSGRREPARVTLQREVRTAAAGAATADEFLGRLADAGLLVRPRFSDHDADVVTGYSVALPGDRTGDGRTVWFGGGRLAADLSWSKLARRWAVGHDGGHVFGHMAGRRTGQRAGRRVRLTGEERASVWRDAATASAGAAHEVRRLSATDPAAASDVAHAAGRALAATARVVEGRAGGPLTAAADQYDRAARELHGRIPAATPTGTGLRAVARLIALTGRAARDETTQVLALIANLAGLADAVAELRAVQQRTAQSAAARGAADQLAAIPTTAHAASRTGAPGRRPAPTATPRGVVNSPAVRGPVHRTGLQPGRPQPPRRRVQP